MTFHDLNALFANVNRAFFENKIVADIDWEIPRHIVEVPLIGANSQSKVPAAGYFPQSRRIVIHPVLNKRVTPKFVLKYLIYHECIHQIIPPEGDNIHTDEFMDYEMRAPNRAKAIDWLKRSNFPTVGS